MSTQIFEAIENCQISNCSEQSVLLETSDIVIVQDLVTQHVCFIWYYTCT